MKIRFTNERSFSQALKKFAEQSQLAPGIIAKRVSFKAFKGVVDRTPVDTGWAQNSWNWAEGSPDLSIPPKPKKGQLSPPAELPAAALTGQFKEFPVFWVTNNLRYIGELEKGHSKQMDKGYMVQRTLVELEADIQDEIRKGVK